MKQARSMISFRAAWLKTLVRSLRRGAVDHQPLSIYDFLPFGFLFTSFFLIRVAKESMYYKR